MLTMTLFDKSIKQDTDKGTYPNALHLCIYMALIKLNTLDAYLIQDHKDTIISLSFRNLKWNPALEERKSHTRFSSSYNGLFGIVADNPFIPSAAIHANTEHMKRGLEAFKLTMGVKDKPFVSAFDVNYIKNFDEHHRPIEPIAVKQVDSVPTPPVDLDDIQNSIYLILHEKAELARKLNIIDGNVTYLDPHAEGLTEVEKSAITLECINNSAYLEHHFKTPDVKRNISGVLNSFVIEMLFRADRRNSQVFQYVVRDLLQISFNGADDFKSPFRQQLFNLRGAHGAFTPPSKLYDGSELKVPSRDEYLTTWFDSSDVAQSKNKPNKKTVVIDSLYCYDVLSHSAEKQKSNFFKDRGIYVDMESLKNKFYNRVKPKREASLLVKFLIARLPKED